MNFSSILSRRSSRDPYQPSTASLTDIRGFEMIPGRIWKIPCINMCVIPLYIFSGNGFIQNDGKKRQHGKRGLHTRRHLYRIELLLFLLFSDILVAVFDIFILQDKHNIRTLLVNIKFICTRCETARKAPQRLSFLAVSNTSLVFADNVCILSILPLFF